ncbi:MAG TPA: chemotaxis protein CheB, partial [Lacipirellulaceae bacterium]|nr:chemotaxis protein CheB [Lacipirellulaceae bacterium]
MAKKKRAKDKDATGQPAEQQDRLAMPVATEGTPRLPFPVVGIGASAGGLEAFIEFFEAMPASPGMSFVLIQHLPPDRESMIAEILAKHSRVPVSQIDDGMAVEVNHVYVIRPGHTVTIKHGRLHLGERLEKPQHNRPVDDFFRSLAEEQRERAICIIMSGMGSNGSAGAESIQSVGGMIIAQDPESAKFPSMPRHLIDSGNADFILLPREMPERLAAYVAHPYVKEEAAAQAALELELRRVQEILNVLRVRTRRDFRGYKQSTVLRRIYRRMGLSQIENMGEYVRALRQSPSEANALADDLMINVTGFFRDADAWEELRQQVIAPLVEGQTGDSPIRCWVTACASGEEAYTLGMLLLEAADAADKPLDIKVFATDTATRALAKARLGIYPMGIESEIEPARLERFFDKNDSVYRVKKELRETVIFAPQNVIQDPPFSRLDLCACRNLLIYLEPPMQRRVLAMVHFGLRDNGVLFLGSSETIAGSEDLFEPIDKRARIFRRLNLPSGNALPPAFAGRGTSGPRGFQPQSIGELANRTLLERYSPPAVTIDRQGQLVFFHGDTGPYLSQPAGTPTTDLLTLVHEQFRGAVAYALHKALTEKAPVTARGETVETDQGRVRLDITVAPLDSPNAPGHSVVTFERHDEPSRTINVSASGDQQDVVWLQQELQRVREHMQMMLEELQSSNEEMQASNEEAMSVNEELQSTNEELETSKEELQSLNEELNTVNVQLQSKMEELEATNNDLASLLSSTEIAVIFLDTQMRIRRFTPAIKDLMELIPSDIGRAISDMAAKFIDPDLVADCRAVLDKLVPIEQEVQSDSGRTYIRRVTPYRTRDNRIDGVVITFVEITELNWTEKALRESEEQFRLVTEGAPDYAMLLIDPYGKIVTWNVGAERLLGWTAAEAIGKSLAIIFPPETGAEQARREMEQAARFGRAADESWRVRKSGTRLWGSGVLSAVRDAEGELTGFVKVMRDETARKQAETERAELLQRERLAREEAENATRLKDQFLAMLSHELRTPIAS